MPAIREDLSLREFPNVVALQWRPSPTNRGTQWLLKCKCVLGTEWWAWAEVIKRKPDLCCLECRKKIFKDQHTIHGGKYTQIYQCHQNIKERCYNSEHKSYHCYGGRGITLYGPWHDFVTFRNAVGEPLSSDMTIERINVNGNYEPGNVKWETREGQANNRRTNILLTAFGKTQTISRWSRELEIDKTTIRKRYLKGWSHEQCLSKEDFRC